MVKVLLVEDDRRILDFLKRGLEAEGYVVDVAENGSDGLAMAEATEYPLVVLDRMLPGLDGLEVCQSLQGRTSLVELEAATVRTRASKGRLEVSGHVHYALLAWDDGGESNAYVVNGDFSSTRFRFEGSSPLARGRKAGFLVELRIDDALSGDVSASDDEGSPGLTIRHAAAWIEGERLGRLTIGQTSPATDNIVKIDLGNAGVASDPDPDTNAGFQLRGPMRRLLDLTWSDIADDLDTARGNVVRYDTPALAGFTFSTAWGEDDVCDVAVRYEHQGEWLRIAGGIGYLWDRDDNDYVTTASSNDGTRVDELKGSVSVLHPMTGLYMTTAGGRRHLDGVVGPIPPEVATFYWAQLGLTRRFLDYGDTIVFGEYGRYDGFGVGLARELDSAAGLETLASSEVDRVGVGVVQKFAAAALEVYGAVHYFDAEIKAVANGAEMATSVPTEAWLGAAVGARIKF